jgi:hypothetical protein
VDHAHPSFASGTVSSKEPPSRKPKPRRRTSGPAFVQIAEDPEDEGLSKQLAQNSGIPKESFQQAPEPELEVVLLDKENAAPVGELGKADAAEAGKPKRKPKKRRSIGQQSGRKKKLPSNESAESIPGESLPDESIPGPVDEELAWETIIGDESSLLPEEVSKPAVRNNAIGKRRRKRKSVVLKSRKRRRSGELSTQSVGSRAELLDKKEASVRGMSEEESPSDFTPSIVLNRATRRRSLDVSNIQTPCNEPTYEQDIEGDETYIDEGASPEKPTPKAPSKKRKAKAKKGRLSASDIQSSSAGTADGPSRMKKSSIATFPILTHRMTNISALPTVAEEAEDDLSSAPGQSSLKNKFTDRSAPNAIDVLAQICRETIANAISKLSTASTTTSTREVKRKRGAFEAFRSEIDSRLFDMSVAVEHRLTIEARVKKARKAKADAQNEWMEVRRQREEIALKCDDIRARNQMMEANGKGTFELSEQLHGLEMVVEKPDLDGECGEYMLRSVAMTVSGAAGAGDGLLARVKDCNRHLERTALMLEGRLAG